MWSAHNFSAGLRNIRNCRQTFHPDALHVARGSKRSKMELGEISGFSNGDFTAHTRGEIGQRHQKETRDEA